MARRPTRPAPTEPDRPAPARPRRSQLRQGARSAIVRAAVVLAAVCAGPAAAAAADPITLTLNWAPTGPFAGYYLARADRLYAAEGLAVELIHGGRSVDALGRLAGGATDLVTAHSFQVAAARAAGDPVVAIMAIQQRSPILFFALARTGIDRPHQFEGRTLRVTADLKPTLIAMMNAIGIAPDRYRTVDLPSDPARVLAGDIPVWGAHFGGLVEQVRGLGHPVNVIYPGDYGIQSYNQVVVTRERTLARDRDRLVRFVRATIQGWRRILAAPERVPDLVRSYDPTTDGARHRQRLIDIAPLVITGTQEIGWMTRQVWQSVIDTLVGAGAIADSISADTLFTTALLDAAYGRRDASAPD